MFPSTHVPGWSLFLWLLCVRAWQTHAHRVFSRGISRAESFLAGKFVWDSDSHAMKGEQIPFSDGGMCRCPDREPIDRCLAFRCRLLIVLHEAARILDLARASFPPVCRTLRGLLSLTPARASRMLRSGLGSKAVGTQGVGLGSEAEPSRGGSASEEVARLLCLAMEDRFVNSCRFSLVAGKARAALRRLQTADSPGSALVGTCSPTLPCPCS